MGEQSCVICQHREPAVGYACDRCRDRIAVYLDVLGVRLADLGREIVPGSGPAAGDRVSTSRVGSPVPGRLEALSLNGPGAVNVRATFYPQIRKWRSQYTVVVNGKQQTVMLWEQAPVIDANGRVAMVPHQDQIGALPPARWMAEWVQQWREEFGHTDPPAPSTVEEPPRVDVLRAAVDPAQSKILTAIALKQRQARDAAVRAMLGIRDGHGGLLPVSARPLDPLAEEWTARFGHLPQDPRAPADLNYLKANLNRACVRTPRIAEFASELRSVLNSLSRVLNDEPDEQWLGRCPATVTDKDTGDSRPCGAGLWQDPFVGSHDSVGQFTFAGQVVCPRCRASWGPKRIELLHLAYEIRRVWPLDRRRRYNLAEIAEIDQQTLRCPACTGVVAVMWQEVTAPDEERTWQPRATSCDNGCAEAERLI